MSMGDLSTFYSLPQSLSSEVYSFPCRENSISVWIFPAAAGTIITKH
jgi:hypothetical protein